MHRKIIKQGVGGRTIFLPIKWVREQGLAPGDEVTIDAEGNNLVIKGKHAAPEDVKEILIDSSITHSHLRSILSSAYKAGHRQIELRFEQQAKLSQLNTIINSFHGLEIIKHSKKKVLIQCFLETQEDDIEPLITKQFQIGAMLLQELMKREPIDIDGLKELVKNNSRRLRDYTLRLINATNYQTERSYDYYDLVTQLEKLNAELLSLAAYLVKNKEQVSHRFEQNCESFEALEKAYRKKSFSLAMRVWNKHHRFYSELVTPETLHRLGMQEEPGFLAHHFSITMRLLHLSSRVLALCN